MRYRSLIVAITSLAAVAPATAEETLADALAAQARQIRQQVDALEGAASRRPAGPAIALPVTLANDLAQFGRAAARLSGDIDGLGGPTDLRCIFRGMAKETGDQLTAIKAARTGGEQADALNRLSHMLRDAEIIAPAATPVLIKARTAGRAQGCPA